MYWTLELASKLEDAPWPATREELIDYAMRSGAPLEVIENLQEMEDEGEVYDCIEDIWPDYPSKEDFFFNDNRNHLSFGVVFSCLNTHKSIKITFYKVIHATHSLPQNSEKSSLKKE